LHSTVKTAIEKINEFHLLNKDDLSSLMNMNEELQRTFQVNQIWRSETEMRYSVLNDTKFPNAKSKYWQAVREQSVFYQELILLAFQYEKELGKQELLLIELDEIDKTTKKGMALTRIKNCNIKLKEFELYNMTLHAKDRLRELKLWEKIKKEQLQKDSTININDFSAHHLEMYENRWKKEMQVAQMTNNPQTFRNTKSNLETLQNDI
tara:strand:- start:70 stop:693 length:624 start_codon:yes stop_codon:yes gene_type:complete